MGKFLDEMERISKMSHEEVEAELKTKRKLSSASDKFFGTVGVVVLVVVGVAWLLDLGPFGWFDGAAEKSEPSESEYRVLTSGLYCMSENDALRLGDAVSRRDSEKLGMLMDTGACRNNAPMFVPVEFLSGSFSTGVRKVAWAATQGNPAGSGFVLPSDFAYMTATELDKKWETWGPICEEYNPGDCATGR